MTDELPLFGKHYILFFDVISQYPMLRFHVAVFLFHDTPCCDITFIIIRSSNHFSPPSSVLYPNIWYHLLEAAQPFSLYYIDVYKLLFPPLALEGRPAVVVSIMLLWYVCNIVATTFGIFDIFDIIIISMIMLIIIIFRKMILCIIILCLIVLGINISFIHIFFYIIVSNIIIFMITKNIIIIIIIIIIILSSLFSLLSLLLSSLLLALFSILSLLLLISLSLQLSTLQTF